MMSPADFKAALPEFAAETDERIQACIDRAIPYFDADRWGDFFDDGLQYKVAHDITLANTSAAQVSVADIDTVKHIDTVHVQRDAKIMGMQTLNPYLRTIYGQTYLYLQRVIARGMLAV